MVIRNEQRTWQLKTVYTVPFVVHTMNIIPNNLHRNSNLLNLQTAQYSLTRKGVIIIASRIIRKFLTE
jgi:hypothetical protein